MDNKLAKQLKIPLSNLAKINKLLADPKNKLVKDALAVIAKYGTIGEINHKSEQARKLPNLMTRLRAMNSPYVPDLEWLLEQRERGAFIRMADYRSKVLGSKADTIRFKALGFEDVVRIEHHITECYKHIVRQPYDRRAELMELAKRVKNISAKHEGGDPELEATREHPSDLLEYFIPKSEVEAKGLMPVLLANYMDKHAALNHTAEELTKHGLAFIAAKNLHK